MPEPCSRSAFRLSMTGFRAAGWAGGYAAALHPRCFLDRSYGVQYLGRAPFVAELEEKLTNLEAAG
jgi:hypothetical protein